MNNKVILKIFSKENNLTYSDYKKDRNEAKTFLRAVRRSPICQAVRKSKVPGMVGVSKPGKNEIEVFFTINGRAWRKLNEEINLLDLGPFGYNSGSVEEISKKFQKICKLYR